MVAGICRNVFPRIDTVLARAYIFFTDGLGIPFRRAP